MLASVDKGTHARRTHRPAFRGVIVLDRRQPACVLCLAKNAPERPAGLRVFPEHGRRLARQTRQAGCRPPTRITTPDVVLPREKPCVPLSTDAKGSTARSKKTPGQLWPGEDGVVGFGGGLGRCQGYEVRSHWISCSYKIAPAEGKVCRTLSRRNFFPRAATLLAIGYIY